MATKTVRVCDRCKADNVVTVIAYHQFGAEYELCKDCARALKIWLSRDNTTRPGDRIGWRETCRCHVPCAGPCNSGGWQRV